MRITLVGHSPRRYEGGESPGVSVVFLEELPKKDGGSNEVSAAALTHALDSLTGRRDFMRDIPSLRHTWIDFHALSSARGFNVANLNTTCDYNMDAPSLANCMSAAQEVPGLGNLKMVRCSKMSASSHLSIF